MKNIDLNIQVFDIVIIKDIIPINYKNIANSQINKNKVYYIYNNISLYELDYKYISLALSPPNFRSF